VQRLDGRQLGERQCDLLAVSGGWSARVHLLAHARGSLRFDAASQSFLPDALPAGFSVAGAANGTQGLQATLEEATATARRICDLLGSPAAERPLPRVTAPLTEAGPGPVAPLPLRPSRRRQWIDLAHDVTVADAELAVREGFVAVEHFKRYTTTGMALDQGKTGNLNAFHVLGGLTGRATGEVGVTTFRPPYVPVTLGVLAGRRRGEFYAPRRILPAQRVHQRLGAHFEDYGWQRPDCYPHGGESPADAIRREVLAVRNGVGVFDNSPIGKLEVCGPDAAEFLDRVYMNRVDNLAPGRARYGLMLNENGVIHDDGVFVRWADDRFVLHTTSAGAGRVCAQLEEWLQCEWPQLRVLIDDLTVQWANFTVAGPRARELLQALGTDIDLAPTTLPHMAAACGQLAGYAVRVVRVSFSGELSYEINVAAGHADDLLERMLAAGEPFDLTPYGIESLMVLRLEKGYLHVGSDTDGSSTPDDVGWGPVARAKAGDYIGKRSLQRIGNLDPDRRQFVGLEPLQPDQPLRPGAHLLTGRDARPPGASQGWVTSSCWSPTLQRWIALGVLRSGRDRLGEVLTACDEEIRSPVRVVSPVFYDPDNERLKG
jgi:sarcosine oxidase subunit alpha